MCRTWKSCRCAFSVSRSRGPGLTTRAAVQKYCDEAVGILDRDTLHLLFPGLNKLLNFQRRFLIKLESIWELPWNERQWGAPFTEFVRFVRFAYLYPER